MRAAVLAMALVTLAGCRGRFSFNCGGDSTKCVRNGAQGQCRPSPVDDESYCVFDDATCPQGRWDATAASAIAGVCVGEEMLDLAASGGGDGGVNDLAVPTYADLAFNGDAAINIAGCTTNADLYGVWGPNTDDVWVVGAQSTIFHYASGAPCEVQTTGVPAGIVLRGVWGRSANDVYVVGDSGIILRSTDRGAHWTNGTMQPATDSFWAAGGTGSMTFAAVENMNGGGTGALYSSSNGSAWTLVSALPSGVNPLDAFWSTATDVWVGGGGGDVYHYDGASWSGNVGTVAAGGYFSGLTGFAPSTLLGVTSHGEIFRYTGSWTKQFDSTASNICGNGMFAVAAVTGRAIAVGKYGCIAVSTDQGGTWKAFDFSHGTPNAPNLHDFNGVWIDPNNQLVLVVGAGGVVTPNPTLP